METLMKMKWKIGSVEIENPFILAPMAGVTDLPFRILCKEQGEFGVAFAIAAILMVLAFLINLSASLVSKYYGRKNRIG